MVQFQYCGVVEGDAPFPLRRTVSDPGNVLQNWDPTLVDPCTWFHVTCDDDSLVTRLFQIDELRKKVHVRLGFEQRSSEKRSESSKNKTKKPKRRCDSVSCPGNDSVSNFLASSHPVYSVSNNLSSKQGHDDTSRSFSFSYSLLDLVSR